MDQANTTTERSEKLIDALQRNWRMEKEGAATYRYLAEHDSNKRRRGLLHRLASVEEEHAHRWADRLRELDADVPDEATAPAAWVAKAPSTEAAFQRIEQEEDEHANDYETQARELGDEPSLAILRETIRDEKNHARILHAMTAPATESIDGHLKRLLGKESWHTKTGSWLGDAIYGVNDGLGAVFGIVSGVSGATGGSHFVLLAGLAGAMASALSMGSGAYLATKSEGEVHQAEITHERREIEESPEEEREELELFYQLKGLSPEEAAIIVDRLAADPEQMLKALAQEELGISEESIRNPLPSALSASISTFIGAMIPVIPFFFLQGYTAVIAAAAISLVAHFAVGAAKTLVTGRSWVESGAEMTIVGAVEGAITYGLGLAIGGRV